MRGAARLALAVCAAALAAAATAAPPDASGILASITASFPAWWNAAEGDTGGAPWATGLLDGADEVPRGSAQSWGSWAGPASAQHSTCSIKTVAERGLAVPRCVRGLVRRTAP